jgi:hypothetical protein
MANETDKEISSPQSSPKAEKPVAAVDLSRDIEKSVERDPLDWVKCAHVFGDFYRCNWWTRVDSKNSGADFNWAGLIADRIRKSRFLKASTRTGQLVISEIVPGHS